MASCSKVTTITQEDGKDTTQVNIYFLNPAPTLINIRFNWDI